MQVDLKDPTDITAVVAAVVTDLLEKQNKTEAADAIGVSRQQLYRWEKAEASPTLEELSRLAMYAGEEVIIKINARDGDTTERLEDVEQTQLQILKVMQDLASDNPAVQRLVARVRRRQEALSQPPPVPPGSSEDQDPK